MSGVPRFDARFSKQRDAADPDVRYTATIDIHCHEAWCGHQQDFVIRSPEHATGLFGVLPKPTDDGEDVLLYVLCPAKRASP